MGDVLTEAGLVELLASQGMDTSHRTPACRCEEYEERIAALEAAEESWDIALDAKDDEIKRLQDRLQAVEKSLREMAEAARGD
jgi:hypothetical protein